MIILSTLLRNLTVQLSTGEVNDERPTRTTPKMPACIPSPTHPQQPHRNLRRTQQTMIILESKQTQTPENKVLDKQWAGEFQLLCTAYTSHPVKLQVRIHSGEWMNAKFNGKEIQLAGQGEVLDIKLTRDFVYRLVTDTPGAEVHIAKHNVHE